MAYRALAVESRTEKPMSAATDAMWSTAAAPWAQRYACRTDENEYSSVKAIVHNRPCRSYI